MSWRLDWADPADLDHLVPGLSANRRGGWIQVTYEDGRVFRVVCVAYDTWWLPGDLSICSADVIEGEPTRIDVLGVWDLTPDEVAVSARLVDLTPGQRALADEALAEDPGPMTLLRIRALADDR